MCKAYSPPTPGIIAFKSNSNLVWKVKVNDNTLRKETEGICPVQPQSHFKGTSVEQ